MALRKLLLILLLISGTAMAQTPMSKLIRKKMASGPTVYLSDQFTGINGTSISAHTMDVGSGWTIQASLSGSCGTPVDFLIQSNQAVPNLGTYSVATADAGQSDVIASVDLILPNNLSFIGGLNFRYTDCANYFMLIIERDAGGTPYMAIYEVSGGSAFNRATVNVPAGFNATLNISVTLSGTSIVALTGTGETCNYTSSNNLTATKFGVWGYDNGAGYVPVPIDNFLVTSL